jgi:hypothetical protein
MVQVPEDLDFQRKGWKIQRIGWVCMALLILAGGLGAAGQGPLAKRAVATSDGGLTVRYERFIRLEAPSTLELRIAPGVEEPALWVSAGYLERIRIRSITPAPREERLGADRHVFLFAGTAPAAGGAISVQIEPHSVGSLVGEAGIVGGQSVGFRQLVLP